MSERTPGVYPGTDRERMPERNTDGRVYIDPEAMPTIDNQPSYLLWSPNDIDGLVHFIYANQGPLFAEDAVLYETWNPERGRHYVIRRDVGTRIKGSWEDKPETEPELRPSIEVELRNHVEPIDLSPMTPTVTVTGYWLTAEDVQTIETALYDNEDRQTAQQEATHDYTPDELRDSARRRTAVRRALKLEDAR